MPTREAMHAALAPPLAASGDERHQQVLVVLRPRLIGAQLAAAFGVGPIEAAPAGALRCQVLDAKYLPGEQCTILYQLGDAMVVSTLAWGAADEEPAGSARVIAPLGMRAYLFPDDPALPSLAIARRPDVMAQALAEGLPACQGGAARVLRCRVTPVRYRPGKRGTLRIDVWLRDTRTGTTTPRTYFGKVYHDLKKATAVYQAMQALADAAPVRAGHLVVPRAVALLPELSTVVQEAVAGTALDLFLGPMALTARPGDPRGHDGLACAARALAALHTVALPSGRPRPIEAELATLGRRAAQVALVDRALSGRISELLRAVAAWRERLSAGQAETSLIHGDCKPSQFLVGAARVALLDFDHCGVGDPAADVGMFLATLRQMGIRATVHRRGPAAAAARGSSMHELAERFLVEYCAASGRRPDFRPRVALYESVALIRKALRAFARSPHSPLPAALVEGARHCYATLSGADCAPGGDDLKGGCL